MKVIVTGATGLVGGAVVQECISSPAITSVIVLSRRPLEQSIQDHPKIKVIIHKDFTDYPASLLDELQGAECCLWSIGGRAYQFPSMEEFHKAQHDTTLTAARTFAERLASAPSSTAATSSGASSSPGPSPSSARKFKFVFCSGRFTEWNQDARLWFLADSRKSKGFVEKGLFDIAASNEDRFEVYCVRPGGIVGAGSGALNAVTAKVVFGIPVDSLARAMCRIAVDGCERHIVENDELVRIGRR